jgi:predicted metalloenzyme YecM
VALVLLGDAMLCLATFLISQIDKLANSTLYNYGLIFSDAWAQSYWLMLIVCMVVIIATIFLISVVELPYPAFEDDEKKT